MAAGTSHRGGNARAVGCLAVAVLVLVVAVLGVFSWLRDRGMTSPIPGQERCVATSGQAATSLDLDQAHFSSIIVGMSVKRGLPPRAASIAMATAYQETGIRNLNYGDRDSVGLFQQRPSQGWGTAQQLMDPYYATDKFYDALVRIKGWRTGDINDVAQQVQRSGHPEAYRDHETDGRVLASTLTGQAPAGFTCLDRSEASGDPEAMVRSLDKTFGETEATRDGNVVRLDVASTSLAWAYASHAVANSKAFGLVSAEAESKRWQTDTSDLQEWPDPASAAAANQVILTVL